MVFALPLILVFLLSWFTEPGPLPHTNTPSDCRTCSHKLSAERVRRINSSHKKMIRKAIKKYKLDTKGGKLNDIMVRKNIWNR